MKINKLKINSYGKLKEKEIDFSHNINIIYGKNEAGKSTLLNFIIHCFYGISKNKKGKEISDFERYIPWVGEEFSGKLAYELDNQETFEIYRDFKKRNPKVYNEHKEEISKAFNVDKNKGNEFFYEQTKIDETLFLSTILVNQKEVVLPKQEQHILIQKIANLVGTGEDNVSFKRAIERIDRRKLEEIGTERSREKPINLISKERERLEKEKKEIEKCINIKYEIEEERKILNQRIEKLENKNKCLKEIKLVQENEKIEKEKIKIKINLKNENDKKIEIIKNHMNELQTEDKQVEEKKKEIHIEKHKLNKKTVLLFIGILVIYGLLYIGIKNKYINFIFPFTVLIIFIFYFIAKNKIKNKEKKIKKSIEKINFQKNNLNYEINLLEKNNIELENEIKELQHNFTLMITVKKEKIKNTYIQEIEENKIRELIQLEDINSAIQELEDKISHQKIALHTLELDNRNIEEKLKKLSTIEEELIRYHQEMDSLKNLEKSINLAKQVLSEAYEEMKNTVTPKFTEALSKMIAEITNRKYTNVRWNDEIGLIVELENGNYMPATRLSIGTIDQLYLSLRLAMVEELSEEKMPIILDEAFAYYDAERLKNMLTYIAKRFKDYQVMIFSCTNREKEILEELGLPYHFIEI